MDVLIDATKKFPQEITELKLHKQRQQWTVDKISYAKVAKNNVLIGQPITKLNMTNHNTMIKKVKEAIRNRVNPTLI